MLTSFLSWISLKANINLEKQIDGLIAWWTKYHSVPKSFQWIKCSTENKVIWLDYTCVHIKRIHWVHLAMLSNCWLIHVSNLQETDRFRTFLRFVSKNERHISPKSCLLVPSLLPGSCLVQQVNVYFLKSLSVSDVLWLTEYLLQCDTLVAMSVPHATLNCFLWCFSGLPQNLFYQISSCNLLWIPRCLLYFRCFLKVAFTDTKWISQTS